MEITYKFIKKEKDIHNSVIEKTGLTAEFTLKDLADKLMEWKKLKVQTQGQLALNKAMVENIYRNEKWILKLTPDQLKVARFVAQKLEENALHTENLKSLDKNYKTYSQELPQLKAALGIDEETVADIALNEYKQAVDVAGDTLKKELKKANGKKKTR